MDTSTSPPTTASDPLVQELLEWLRSMGPGQTLRIPIMQEKVVVYKRPVVVEEITIAKRSVQQTQHVTAR